MQFGPIPISTTQANVGLDGIAAGLSYVRVRFGWWFGGTTSTSVVVPSIMAQPVVVGICTTIGNGTEPKPDPIDFPNDEAPPSERWIWHERRWPQVVAWDAAGATVIWQSSPPQEVVDTKGQVLAPGTMGAGNTLNCWFVARCAENWDTSGAANLFGFANVLTRTP